MSESNKYIETQMGSEKGFGIVFAIVFSIIGFFPLLSGDGVQYLLLVDVENVHQWSLIVAPVFLILAYLAPKTLSLPNRLWFKLGMALGDIIAPIVMALVYFIAVVPTGLIVKLMRKDLLHLKLNKKTQSYWIKRDDPVGPMTDQF